MHLRDDPVEVRVARPVDVQVATANVVDGLVVDPATNSVHFVTGDDSHSAPHHTTPYMKAQSEWSIVVCVARIAL